MDSRHGSSEPTHADEPSVLLPQQEVSTQTMGTPSIGGAPTVAELTRADEPSAQLPQQEVSTQTIETPPIGGAKHGRASCPKEPNLARACTHVEM